ncbi:MAG TPA: DUF4112 domain-containing protein [Bacteriovoracaceae bacterium]|nr:DUF4112 domain-containing protein [Bacteriovoracaceae bacterium]
MTNENLKQLRDLTAILDTKFKGPLGLRFGLDGLLGFIPVVGDFVTSGLSLYIIIQAGRMGCSPSTLVRMGLNVLAENLADSIPIFGNFFDLFWKSNVKNMSLLEEYLQRPQAVTWKSRVMVGVICFALIGIVIGAAAVTVKIIEWVISLF